MAPAHLRINPAGVVAIFIGLAAWCVSFGGMIASTKFCDYINRGGYCSQLFQLEWYSIWLELGLLLAMLLTCFHQSFERGRYIFLCFLSMSTFFLSLTARDFITNSFKAGSANLANFHSDAYTATAVGVIILCIVNYLLIILVGINAGKANRFILMGQGGAGMVQFNINMPNLHISNLKVPGFGNSQPKYVPSGSDAF